MWHAIQVDSALNIGSQLGLQVAGNVVFEQAETIMGRTGGVCLLNDQLSAFVEALQGARNGERQEQPDQGKYGALDRGQPRHIAGLFLKVSLPETSSVAQQDQRADEEGGSDRQRKENEDHLQIPPTDLGGTESDLWVLQASVYDNLLCLSLAKRD